MNAKFTAVLMLVVGLVACEDAAGPSGPPPLSPMGKLVSDLSMFAVGQPPSPDEITDSERALADGKLTIEAYVDQLLQKPMGGRFAKDLVVGPGSGGTKDRHPLAGHSILQSFEDGGRKIHHLGKPCSSSEAVKVAAWWGDDVWVCPQAYKPDVLFDDQGRMCGSTMLSPRDADICGCGPGLMWCHADRGHFERMQGRIVQEVVDTVAYVVDGDLPIDQLFTMNETVRTADAEFVYRRARVAAGEDPSLLRVKDLPERKGKLATRHEQVPGQHAGLLTTPVFTYSSDALRGVMRNFYDYLWCSGIASSKVTTDAVLELESVDLRVGDGWKQLAAMSICTDCHARLDYGMQFFWGYPSSTQGVDFRPKQALAGTGPLYGDDIRDPRGTAELTPNGFAKLATAQPEFGDCMSRKVVDHVFNGSATARDFDAVRDAFEESRKIKAMLRVAMLRYAKRELRRIGGVVPGAAADDAAGDEEPVLATGDKVAISTRLVEMIDRDCKQCHDVEDKHVLVARELDRTTLQRMIDMVGFGTMPKGGAGLDDGTRRAFVAEIAKHLYPPGTARDTAIAFFSDGMRAQSVHRYASAMKNVAQQAKDGAREQRPSAIEGSVAQSQMSFTPSVAASAGVVALKACRDAGRTGEALIDCVAHATDPSVVVVGQ